MYKVRLALMVVLSGGLVFGAAVLALGRGTRPRESDVAQVLLRQLADSDPDVRRDAEGEFKKMGPSASPILREACGSPDMALARRARQLLDEMEGRIETSRVEESKEEVPVAVPAEPSGAPVELELVIPQSRVRAGVPIPFYVRLTNRCGHPLWVARHRMRVLPLYSKFAEFEVTFGEDQFTVPTDQWPMEELEAMPTLEVLPVASGMTVDLYMGQCEIPTALYSRLMRPGEYQLRFVYDARVAYREALARSHPAEPGLALPAERIVSNAVTVVVE